ncbi:MAG: response regulator [Chloroflexi bacterium]|nr:MAG: response regulator [Chloroflexota bacterium]
MYESPKKSRILIVEDEVPIQQVLSFFLQRNGFETLVASNGQEAMQIIPEFNPQLVILDLIMQPGSGWDVLHWMRLQHLTPRIPVLVVSALVHLSEQVQGFEEGAIEYLTKPTQPSIIVERVRAILALNMEQRLMLQHKRIDERRRVLERIHAVHPDEMVY